MPTGRPANSGASVASKASYIGEIASSSYGAPSRATISRLSIRLMSAVYGEGIITACTLSAPSASTATASVNAESMPPDKPSSAPGKPFLPI